MEKFKVTFEANDQQLKSLGTKHASDTYADIEATFILGSRWTDMDSVSAVWWNDFTKIATVLDNAGKCIVPHEVLTRKGYVRVNLVGSVVENDELVTRLTSYSAEAVKVNEKIKLTGSETSEITPSQFEQFVVEVKADADRAESGATASESSANSARTSADEAEVSAENASESASASAISASDSARSAQDASEIAVEVEVMKNEVELAKDKVLGMRATATTLEAGSGATASYSDGLLSLGIPKGDTGDTGAKGDKGDTGATPNLTIGTVSTLEPNTDATASITGTTEEPILNLGIPKGDTGEVSLEDLEALLPTDTASGDIVTIPDGQSVIPAESLKVALEPIQSLNGYDRPWVGGAGKNKFNGADVITSNSSNWGVDWNESTNTLTITHKTEYSTGAPLLPLDLEVGTYVASFASQTKTASISLYTNGAYTDILRSGTTFSVESGNSYEVHFTADVGTPNVITKLQIELGSTATDYSPYSNICPISGRTEVDTIVSPTISAEDGTTHTTDLGQTVYGGTLDVVSGVLTVDRAIVTFDGSEDEPWLRFNTGSASAYGMQIANNDFNIKLSQGREVTAIANYLVGISASATWGDYDAFVSTTPTYQNTIITGIKSITTVEDWKTYLAQNPLQVVYELANPQTYQLTPQEIRLLLGTNNIWSDGNVTLVYSADIQKWVEKKLNGNSTTLTMSRPMTAELNETETETETE